MKVAIVGGGSSGLAAAKACIEVGLEPVVYERDSCLGGLWKTGSGGRVWTSMKMNLSRHTCCFSDFRWPEDAPTFPSCAQVRQYIEDYAVHFDLARYVRFGHEVTNVAQSASGEWEVTFVSSSGAGDGSAEKAQKVTEVFDKCIIASGIFVTPYFPPPEKVRGITEAVEAGWATHSGLYRDPEGYSGQSTLVVGCAFSGAEIACDLTETVRKCVVATGGPSVFLPRVFSMPTPDPDKQPAALDDAQRDSEGAKGEHDVSSACIVSVALGGTGVSVRGTSSASPDEEGAASRVATNKPTGCCGDSCGGAGEGHTGPESGAYGVPLDIELYSLKAAAGEKAKGLSAEEKLKGLKAYFLHLAGQDPGDVHEALRLESDPKVSTNVAISEGFLDKVRDGAIDVRPRLVALDVQEHKAHFSDGTSEHVDHVICCTGLRLKIGFLPADILEQYEFDENDSVQPLMLHAQTWNPCVPSLAFVGVYRAPYFGVTELQARWAARMWSGAVPPPTAEISKARLQERRDVRNAEAHSQFATGYLEIMEALAEVAGLVPTRDWSVHAGGDSPFIQETTASANVRDGAMGLNGSLSAIPKAGAQASTTTDGYRGQDNGITPTGADAETPPKSQHSVEMALFAEALAEISPDGDEERGMLMLKEWLWSGPLLPCHYRVREFLAHGTAVALGDAVREIQVANTIYPGYVKV